MEFLSARPQQKIILAAFVFLFLAIAFVWARGFSENDFTNPDALDYAQMGREIFEGHGFATKQLFPRHIPFLFSRGYLESEHIPNLNRYPLPTLADAFFRIFTGNIAQAAVLQSGVWFLASIPLLFLLAWRLTGPAVALLSTTLYAASSSSWDSSYNGMTESLAKFVVLTIVCVTLLIKASKWKYLAAGALCGLALLTRTQLFFLFPLVVVLLWFMLPRADVLKAFVWLSAGFMLIMGPWMARNFAIAGDPLFSFNSTRALVLGTELNNSDLEMRLHAPVQTSAVLARYGAEIWAKIKGNLWPNVLNPAAWVGSALFALLVWVIILASMLVPGVGRSREYALFKRFLFGLILANFLTVGIVLFYNRFFEFLYPLILVAALQELVFIVDRFAPARARQAAVSGVLGALMLAGTLRIAQISARYAERPAADPLESQTYEILAESIDPGSVVASDISQRITLYDELLTVRLPTAPSELLEISHDYLPIDYIVFSSKIMNADPSTHTSMFGNYTAYLAFMQSKRFLAEYEFIQQLPNGAALYRRIK